MLFAWAPLTSARLEGQTPTPSSDSVMRQWPGPDTAAITRAMAVITPDEVRRAQAALSGTAPHERVVGSAALEAAARALDDEFARLGIPRWNPDDSSGVYHYPQPAARRLDDTASSLTLYVRPPAAQPPALGGLVWEPLVDPDPLFTTDTLLQGDRTDDSLTLLTGRHTAATIAAAKLADRNVLYLPPAGTDAATQNTVVAALARANNVLVLPDEDLRTFARRSDSVRANPPVIVERFMGDRLGYHRWTAIGRMGPMAPFFAALHLDPARLRAETAPAVRTLAVWVLVRLEPRPAATAPQGAFVVRKLVGSDSVQPEDGGPIMNEVVCVSAPLDSPDAAGLLVLAKAFNQPGARLRRSIAFVATSGGAYHNAGARAFAEYNSLGTGPTFMGFTLWHLGALPADSVSVRGLTDFDFKTPPQWLMTRRPELDVALRDAGTALTSDGDHLALVDAHAATLAFDGHPGAAPDTAATTPESEPFDAAAAARRLRVVYRLIQDLANESTWPRFKVETRAWWARKWRPYQ